MQKEITKEELAQISRFARKEVGKDEIYTFDIVLCDNDIDRDGEKFTVLTLKKLGELFVGKTGIFDHDLKSKNQTARIYSCEVVSDSNRKTADGEIYTCLKAKAYMVRNEKNQPLIDEIEAGIKKETSVNCCVEAVRCSICGEDVRATGCEHRKGKIYGNKICCHILEGALDAYEWSFVAVPAQKGAGVVKAYTYSGAVSQDDIEEYRKELKEAIIISGARVLPEMPSDCLENICKSLKLKELKDMKDAFQKAADKDLPLVRQLEAKSERNIEADKNNSQFII